MNDVLAMAVFREHERRGARLNAAGATARVPAGAARSPRERLVAALFAAASWLAPAPRPAALPGA